MLKCCTSRSCLCSVLHWSIIGALLLRISQSKIMAVPCILIIYFSQNLFRMLWSLVELLERMRFGSIGKIQLADVERDYCNSYCWSCTGDSSKSYLHLS